MTFDILFRFLHEVSTVKIKSMLVRLQNALGQTNIIEQMVLSAGSDSLDSAETKSEKTVNLVIGYNGSSNSQIALDLTLWIAHQTRLATQKRVMVHVVYVIDRHFNDPVVNISPLVRGRSARRRPASSGSVPETMTATLPRIELDPGDFYPDEHAIETCLNRCEPVSTKLSTSLLEQADAILWQARCLAEEWRGSLEAHLRFGKTAEELGAVAESIGADLLLLGCSSDQHTLVQQLAPTFPCPILGIPIQLEGI